MPENEKDPGDEKLLILPLGEESKKITQVISNDTARQIIALLADTPLSASDIAERLQAPLTTITYNLENLESVGLVKVERVKYSEKGRKVKIYAPVRKVIVVVPEKTDRESVLDILRKYMGVVLAAVLASSVIEFFTKGFALRSFSMDLSTAENTSTIMPSHAPVKQDAEKAIAEEMIKDATVQDAVSSGNFTPAPTPVPTEIAHTTALAQSESGILANIIDTILAHPGLVFLLGCLFVISALVIIDLTRKKKNR